MDKIVAVKKDAETGNITFYKWDSGEVTGVDETYDLISQGVGQEHYMVSLTRAGTKNIRTKRNETEDDNLSNLPSF